MTEPGKSPYHKVRSWLFWWARWWVRTFPVAARRRLTCKHPVRYDGYGPCLDCYSPWFFDRG